MLEANGFDVLVAQDGREALEVFKANASAIAAVLLDLVMPGMGGEATLLALHELRPKLPVLLSSGYDEADTTRCFSVHQLAGFVHKPYRQVDLIKKLDALLSR